MAHTKQDVILAKNEYFAAADRFMAILHGALAAMENGKRGGLSAANMLVDDEPLTLTDAPKPSMKDLAAKMGG